MANPDHHALLLRGVREWNDWRAASPAVRPDLAGAELSQARIPLANLADADLREANLVSADLRKSKLATANLGGANLGGADLAGADLAGADLRGAYLTAAKLAAANLAGADLRRASLLGADLREADLTGARLGGADLRKAELRWSVFAGADAAGARFAGAVFDTGAAAALYLTSGIASGFDAVPRVPVRDLTETLKKLSTMMDFAGGGGPVRDPVLLGAAAPPAVRPGREFTARFVAYVRAAEIQVESAVSKLSPGSALHLDLRECQWKPGSEVAVELTARHLEIAEPRQTFVWSGRWNLVEFDVAVPAGAPRETTILKYGVFIAGVRVAQVRVDLDVDPAAPLKTPPARIGRGEPARSAFASYASEDRARVLDRVAALRISAGLDVFQDCLSLHPGEAWKPRLEKEIALRDLFLLFWSRHAKTSPWVEWEWRAALTAKPPEALELHPLEPVDAAPPPDELSHLHFGDPLMTIREYESRPE